MACSRAGVNRGGSIDSGSAAKRAVTLMRVWDGLVGEGLAYLQVFECDPAQDNRIRFGLLGEGVEDFDHEEPAPAFLAAHTFSKDQV